MSVSLLSSKLKLIQAVFPSSSSPTRNRCSIKPAQCSPLIQTTQLEDVGIMCEPCSGKGWLLCGFCNGLKKNVKAENNRIYRRCPSCRAIGYVLCSKCKVFKCVSFPDGSDVSKEDVGIMCEPCSGKGWLLCGFCNGLKKNVKAENNRIYRRCPSCRAIGYVLCSKCKVFKCVSFPDGSDGGL